ncbi:MAG TPA: peptidase M56, partial [Flavobacteriaceae bacterium]|nr:peptidase M56 [Flavobacteriaceae bacterium]
NEIPEEVLLHEHAHAKQMHSVDILFIELLHVLFWFNPLFIFLKRSMKLNHEFLADRAVLKQGAETSVYQKLLLAYSSHAVTPQLA